MIPSALAAIVLHLPIGHRHKMQSWKNLTTRSFTEITVNFLSCYPNESCVSCEEIMNNNCLSWMKTHGGKWDALTVTAHFTVGCWIPFHTPQCKEKSLLLHFSLRIWHSALRHFQACFKVLENVVRSVSRLKSLDLGHSWSRTPSPRLPEGALRCRLEVTHSQLNPARCADWHPDRHSV